MWCQHCASILTAWHCHALHTHSACGDADVLCSGQFAASYLVKSGDTMSAIASICNVQLPDLVSANPQLPNASLIVPNNTVCVPSNCSLVLAAAVAAPPPPVSTPTPVPTATPKPAPANSSAAVAGERPAGHLLVQASSYVSAV